MIDVDYGKIKQSTYQLFEDFSGKNVKENFSLPLFEINGFYCFFVANSKSHFLPSTKIWVNRRVVRKNKMITFPVWNAKMEKTRKGNLVIRHSKDTNLYMISVKAVYRSKAHIRVVDKDFVIWLDGLAFSDGWNADFVEKHPDCIQIFRVDVLHSPRGKCGQSAVFFLNKPKNEKLEIMISHNGTHTWKKLLLE